MWFASAERINGTTKMKHIYWMTASLPRPGLALLHGGNLPRFVSGSLPSDRESVSQQVRRHPTRPSKRAKQVTNRKCRLLAVAVSSGIFTVVHPGFTQIWTQT